MAKVYLIPNTISEEGLETLPAYLKDIVSRLRHFVVEEEREGRRFLKKLCPEIPLPACAFFVVNEHTAPKEFQGILEQISQRDMGLISEAGCPCVADPGAELVLLAHQQDREIVPLVGPSSIVLALMGSGLNGQNFAFNGYLPKEREARIRKIKLLEKRSLAEDQTQIFMDTPYRNQHVFEDILSHAQPQTFLCLAADLTGKEQDIKTLTVEEWKKRKPSLAKKPVLFLIHQRN